MKGDLGYFKYSGEKNCPRCKHPVYGYPALSRIDNHTYGNGDGSEPLIKWH